MPPRCSPPQLRRPNGGLLQLLGRVVWHWHSVDGDDTGLGEQISTHDVIISTSPTCRMEGQPVIKTVSADGQNGAVGRSPFEVPEGKGAVQANDAGDPSTTRPKCSGGRVTGQRPVSAPQGRPASGSTAPAPRSKPGLSCSRAR